MTEPVLIVVIAAAFSIAMGKALDSAPIPQWLVWAVLAVVLLVGVLLLRGVVSTG